MKPNIITFEDFETMTDRWGGYIARRDGGDPSAEETAAIEALLPPMYDEITFIVRRGTTYGLLFELEYDDGKSPSDRDADTLAETAVIFPMAEFYFTQGDHTFGGRATVRAFLPAERVTADLAERIGRAVFWIMGERVG